MLVSGAFSLYAVVDGKDGLSPMPNLLDCTAFDYSVSEHWTVFNGSISGGNGMFSTNEVYASASSASLQLAGQPIYGNGKNKVTMNEWYTLSFWGRGTAITVFCENAANNIIATSAGCFRDGNREPIYNDINKSWTLDNEYTLHTLTFRIGTNVSPTTLIFRIQANQSAHISAIKLEQGKEATPWCLSEADKKGYDGVGISKVENYYAACADGVVPNSHADSGSGYKWTKDVTAESKKINASVPNLWNYEKIIYTDTSVVPTRTDAAVIMRYAKDGTEGRGIKEVVEEYITENTGNKPAENDSRWNREVTKISPSNRFLWNRERIIYTKGTPGETKTDAVLIGVYGDKGADGTSVKIKGSLNAPVDLKDKPKVEGDGWMIRGDLWVYNGNTLNDPKHAYGFENVGKIQGPKGDSVKGDAGDSAYVHIAYANFKDGKIVPGSFNKSDPGGREYIGVCTDKVETDPELTPGRTDGAPYFWSLIKGEDAVTINVSPESILHKLEPGKGGLYEVHIKLWEGSKDVKFFVAEDNRYNYDVSTLPDDLSKDGISWNFDMTPDGFFYYRIFFKADVNPISRDIPFTITYKGVVYERHINLAIVKDGKNGENGSSVDDVHNYYLASSKSTGVTILGYNWVKDTIPPLDSVNKYLWNYEEIVFSDGREPKRVGPSLIGNFSKGIKDIVEEYGLSNNASTPPSSFSPSIPEMTPTQRFLWNRETILYTDGSKDSIPAHVVGVYGEKGEDGMTVRPNLLDGTRLIDNSNGYWYAFMGNVIQGGGLYGTNAISTRISASYTDFLVQTIQSSNVHKLLGSTWYTISFYAKGSSVSLFLFNPSGDVVDTSAGCYVDGIKGTLASDVNKRFLLTSEYVRHSVTFKTKVSPQKGDLIFRGYNGQNITICAMKLEEGTMASPWCISEADKMGIPGPKGAAPRFTKWAPNTDYLSGGKDEDWYDVVEYETGSGILHYLCTKSHRSTADKTPPKCVSAYSGEWEETKKYDLLLADKIAAKRIDTEGLVVNELYTKSVNDTFIEIKEGLFKAFASERGLHDGTNKSYVSFGIDSDGNQVLQFYDKRGVLMCDFGPNGYHTFSTVSWKQIELAKKPETSTIMTPSFNFKVYYQYSAGQFGDSNLDRRIYTSDKLMGQMPAGSFIPDGWYIIDKVDSLVPIEPGKSWTPSAGDHYDGPVPVPPGTRVYRRAMTLINKGAITMVNQFYCYTK